MPVTFAQWRREQEGLAELRVVVDRLCRDVFLQKLNDRDLELRLADARQLCATLFPDRLELFDLIHASRVRRLRDQFGPPAAQASPEKAP